MFEQNYQTCEPNQSLEKVNGYNIKVDIQSRDGMPMSELNFECEFWIEHSGRKVVVGKESMVEVVKDCRDNEFYAQLYSTELGNVSGWLFCTIAIQQPDPNWPCGYRDVTLDKVFTGIYLGKCCGRYPRVPRCTYTGKNWQDGFKVNFEKVDYLPKASWPYLYFGAMRSVFMRWEDLGTCQAAELRITPEKPKKPITIDVRAGETVAVLTPEAMNVTVKKDDGFGNKVDFDETFFGANGVPITLGDDKYIAYGERMTVSGKVTLYIE